MKKTTVINLIIMLMVLTLSTVSAQTGSLPPEKYAFFEVFIVVSGTSDQPGMLIDFPTYYYYAGEKTLTSYEDISVTDTTKVLRGHALSLSGEVGGGTSSYLSANDNLIVEDVYSIDTNGNLEYNLNEHNPNGTWITLAPGQSYTVTENLGAFYGFTGNLDVKFTVKNLGIWDKSKITAPNATATPEPPADDVVGDVNDDGAINIVDALLTAQYYVGLTPSVFDTPAADVNVDDAVNIIDALLIARYYVGLITDLPEALPGGYGQVSKSAENVLVAYGFLADDLSATQPDIFLGDIKLAFSQVVAGINYRLVCNYHSNATESDHYLAAVIFFDTEMIPQQVSSLKLDIY